MSDLKDELEQERREKEWAETWKPGGSGDMLIGTLEGYDEATTDFGTYRVAHIRDEEGVLRALWLMHSVLQDEWDEAGPEIGERVGVQYHGKRSGENYDYHMWAAKVDRTDATATGDAPQESETGTGEGDTAAGGSPQNESDPDGSNSNGSGRAPKESGGPQGFPEDKLFGAASNEPEPAGGESTGGESTLDDPNGGLPF